MSKDLSLAIRNLRIPLALLIVIGHSDIFHFPLISQGGAVEYDQTIITYPITYLCRVLFAPANSLFFAISGYLFFSSLDSLGINEYRTKIRKRFHTLFLPYVIWQLIFLVPSILGALMGRYDYSVIWFVQSIWSTPDQPIPADPPLWFLRDLMVCMLMSPVYYAILKRKLVGIIFLLSSVSLWLFDIWPLPLLNGVSSLSIVFFALGAFVGIQKLRISEQLLRYGGGISLLFALITIIDLLTTKYIPQSGDNVKVVCISQVNNLVILLACVVYPYLAIRFSNIFNKLDIGGSFVIYASHWGFLLVINALIIRLCPVEISSITAMFLFALRVSFAFFGAWLVGKLISHNSVLLKLLAGGRI